MEAGSERIECRNVALAVVEVLGEWRKPKTSGNLLDETSSTVHNTVEKTKEV